jgi:hypothetical protein
MTTFAARYLSFPNILFGNCLIMLLNFAAASMRTGGRAGHEIAS